MCNYLRSTLYTLFALGTIISILGSGCATTEKIPKRINDMDNMESNDESSEVKPDYYQLGRGDLVPHAAPLPQFIPFHLKVFADGTLVENYLKYRGWDFNRDGIVDMLEELSPNGDHLGFIYDFDFDGNMDLGKSY